MKFKTLKALAATLAMLLSLANPSYGRSNRIEINIPERIISASEYLSFKDFPKAVDILAIIKVESRFQEKARNGVSHGLMQVNHGPWGVFENIQAGVKLLREYYESLGSIPAAIQAYNIGIGAYRKGKRAPSYLHKYRRSREEIDQWYHDRNVGGYGNSGSLASDISILGLAGGICITSLSEAGRNPLCGRTDGESNLRDEVTREVPFDLGKVESEYEIRSQSWDSYSGYSAGP